MAAVVVTSSAGAATLISYFESAFAVGRALTMMMGAVVSLIALTRDKPKPSAEAGSFTVSQLHSSIAWKFD